MLQILINGQVVNLGQQLPNPITSCSIIYNPLFQVGFTAQQLPAVKQWFNQLIDNCTCEYVIFNDTFHPVTTLNKFKDIQ